MENTTEIITNKQYHDKLAMILDGLDPRYCHKYEFLNAAEIGVNCGYCAIQQHGTVTVASAAKRARETGEPVWVIAPYFKRCNQTIEQYMNAFAKRMDTLKNHYQVWDTIVGFYWEQPLAVDGFTSEDLLEMTKAVSEAFEKRIFVTFSKEEVAGKAFKKEDSKYITDALVKCNQYDFRKPLDEEICGKTFTSAEDIYRYYTEEMKELMADADNLRVWYYPCAAIRPVNECGAVSDEDFCIASLQGFKKLLLEEKKPGGLYVDGFKSYIDRDKLDWHLDAENPNRWNKYIEVAKKVCDELKAIDVK